MGNVQGNVIEVSGVETLGKGKYRVSFSDGITCLLYRGEMRAYGIEEGRTLGSDIYSRLMTETLGKRAKKRAMYLLEQMDRTEKQLREKLLSNEYPQVCIDDAVEYVKRFHYLDDYRYACNFIRYGGAKLSRQMVRQKLMQKGVDRKVIEAALEEEYSSEELPMIQALLEKRHFVPGQCDDKEFRKTYQYLLRRGFQSSEILKAMKCENCTISSGDY